MSMKLDFSRARKLFKPKWAITTLFVIAGALVGTDFDLRSTSLLRLLLTLILFQLWYSAIYIIADIIDYQDDLSDHIKSKRPMPSGLLDRTEALECAILVFVVSGVFSYILSPELLLFEVAFFITCFTQRF